MLHATEDTTPISISLGKGFSGFVKEFGEGVLAIKQGDNVYGQAAVISGRSGVFSRAISANAESIAHKPKSLSYTEAAALPIGAMRAMSYSSHNR